MGKGAPGRLTLNGAETFFGTGLPRKVHLPFCNNQLGTTVFFLCFQTLAGGDPSGGIANRFPGGFDLRASKAALIIFSLG